MPYFFYDIIIGAILALFLWLGWKKGLLLSLCGLAVILLSLVGAGFIADTAAPPVAKAIQPKLAAAIEENVTSYLDTHFDALAPIGDPDNANVNMWDGMREMGGIYAWCADSVEDTIDHINRVMDPSEMFAIAANRVATQLAHHILFVIAFVVLFILLTLLLHVLDLVAKLPGLHVCNGLGGAAVGLAKGVLVLFVAVCVLQVFFSRSIPPEAVENTYLLKLFVRHNPILSLFQR